VTTVRDTLDIAISTLAERLLDRLSGSQQDPAAFAVAAEHALQDSRQSLGEHAASTCEWLVTATCLPEQVLGENDYGGTTITVYRHSLFRIEVLVWGRGVIEPHQHDSAGAFLVLAGSRLHSAYVFNASVEATQTVLLGDLRRTTCELLEPGDIRSFEPGPALIHDLCYLDNICTTISVRSSAVSQKHAGRVLFLPHHIAWKGPEQNLVSLRTKRSRGVSLVRLVEPHLGRYLLRRMLECGTIDDVLHASMWSPDFDIELLQSLPPTLLAPGMKECLVEAAIERQRRRFLEAALLRSASYPSRLLAGLLICEQPAAQFARFWKETDARLALEAAIRELESPNRGG
jgi:hypothetical protein